MRLLLASLFVAGIAAALPAAAYADPTACATTINSKGVKSTVCNPGEPSQNEPTCWYLDPWPEARPVPYVLVCVAL